MTASFLITGGNPEERYKKAAEIVKKVAQDSQWRFTNNPDFFQVESENLVGIEEIRSLQEKIKLKPFRKKVKAVLIKRGENLTPEAQNALLKTLEEPPAKTLIILTSPDPGFLLPTIVSRCQLIQLSAKSQITLDNKELQACKKIFLALGSSSIGERFKILEEEVPTTDRQQAIEWLDKMICFVRCLLINNYLKTKKELSLNSSPTQSLQLLKSLMKTKFFLQINVNTRLAFEVFLLDLPFLTC
jgi:hypothetical protein